MFWRIFEVREFVEDAVWSAGVYALLGNRPIVPLFEEYVNEVPSETVSVVEYLYVHWVVKHVCRTGYMPVFTNFCM